MGKRNSSGNGWQAAMRAAAQQEERERRQAQRSSSRRNRATGLHETFSDGGFVTANDADDPRAAGGHYVSYGDNSGHVTQVFDAEGNEID